MSGLFAEWQPRYAEHGVATFPVGPDKRPAVSHYMRTGLKGSQQLAFKFPANDAFGFACNKRNKVAVLDVDTPDERVLADALSWAGQTPIIVRSGSGNFQAWYRHTGKGGRRVRPFPGKPIDVLQDGYVVAPPSMGSNGRYEFLQGSLDDLDRLPPMQANSNGKETCASSEGIAKGQRNERLFKHCLKQARHCDDFDALLDVARTYADNWFSQSMTDAEIVKTAQSAWSYEETGSNWCGNGHVAFSHEIVSALAASDPHALALLSILKQNNGHRETFILSKSMAHSLGWTLPRFKQARDKLVQAAVIACMHEGGRGKNDPPVYTWAKGV